MSEKLQDQLQGSTPGPSSLQPLHHLHGTNVLAVADGPGYFRAYFLSGDTIDMRVSDLSLSLGWKTS